MMRFILFFFLIPFVAYANMTLTLSVNGKGYAYRGDGTDNTNTVFNIVAQETAAVTAPV